MVIEILLGAIIVLLMINLWITHKKSDISKHFAEIRNNIILLDKSLEKIDKSIRDDFQRNREESNKIAKENRDELTKSLSSFSENFAFNL